MESLHRLTLVQVLIQPKAPPGFLPAPRPVITLINQRYPITYPCTCGRIRTCIGTTRGSPSSSVWVRYEFFYDTELLCQFHPNKITDGGGIRGLSSLYILQELMEKIKEEENLQDAISKTKEQEGNSKLIGPQPSVEDEIRPVGAALLPNDSTNSTTSGNSTNWNICHYFDFIVGTSTGGYGVFLQYVKRSFFFNAETD